MIGANKKVLVFGLKSMFPRLKPSSALQSKMATPSKYCTCLFINCTHEQKSKSDCTGASLSLTLKVQQDEKHPTHRLNRSILFFLDLYRTASDYCLDG